MHLQQVTVDLLQELESANWFSRVGNCEVVQRNSKCVRSWEDAAATAQQPVWMDALTDMGNDVRTAIADAHKSWVFMDGWNDCVDELKTHILPLVQAKIENVPVGKDQSKPIVDTLNYIVLHGCLLCEYLERRLGQDILLGLLTLQILEGRLPCGWEGEYPSGRMIIF